MQIDSISFAGGVVLVLIILSVLTGKHDHPAGAASQAPVAGPVQVANAALTVPIQQPATPQPIVQPAIAAPYAHYILTQGPHGASYGHMAIDITAGKGATIGSPITGVVTGLYTDGLGNSVLVIENDQYRVTLLHGVYTVIVGQALTLGQAVGSESNIGNTRDFEGNSCAGRDCGYHTHLNIYDKRLGANVNPLLVLGRR
jgi:murein DD-endopeptidase MepM/ murein hydrolase activator NlpD